MKQVSIAGANWAYSEQGSGKPVVLVHGFPLDRRLWSGVASELASTYHVISVDLPGFGQSTLGPGFTIQSLADGLAEFGRQLHLTKFALAGLSMGGYVVEAFASKYESMLSSLILVDTKAEADNPQQKQGRDKMIELVRTSGSKAVADDMLGKMLSPETIRQSPQMVRDLRMMMEAVPPKTIETALAAMRDRNEYLSLLPKLTVPLLIIVGQDDVIAPPTLAQAMQQAAPKAKLAIIPTAGHLAPLEQPKSVATAIRDFL